MTLSCYLTRPLVTRRRIIRCARHARYTEWNRAGGGGRLVAHEFAGGGGGGGCGTGDDDEQGKDADGEFHY